MSEQVRHNEIDRLFIRRNALRAAIAELEKTKQFARLDAKVAGQHAIVIDVQVAAMWQDERELDHQIVKLQAIEQASPAP